MVKDLHSNLDEVLKLDNLSYMINTHLLMFENYIVYIGIITNYDVVLGNSFKKLVIDDMKNAINYYHF